MGPYENGKGDRVKGCRDIGNKQAHASDTFQILHYIQILIDSIANFHIVLEIMLLHLYSF